jgi:mannose-6-phosphate isomerase-like protein (cupin superfamily)
MSLPPVINLFSKLDLLDDHWAPKIVARMNTYHFKVVKLQGAFVWHRHAETDETFIVLEGSMRIEFRSGTVELARGEMIVVPQGVEHRPVAEAECSVLLVEPAGTVNTGDAPGGLTAPDGVWI